MLHPVVARGFGLFYPVLLLLTSSVHVSEALTLPRRSLINPPEVQPLIRLHRHQLLPPRTRRDTSTTSSDNISPASASVQQYAVNCIDPAEPVCQTGGTCAESTYIPPDTVDSAECTPQFCECLAPAVSRWFLFLISSCWTNLCAVSTTDMLFFDSSSKFALQIKTKKHNGRELY